MYLKSRILYLYVETPLHAGAGAGIGVVDLPIQRERISGYPIIQASGVKGALRESAPDGGELSAVFGPEPEQSGHAYAGAVSFGDARLLLFPVRSLKGVFAWTTSLNVLQRWQREVKDILTGLPALPEREPAITANNETCCYAGAGVTTTDGYVVLEEFAFKVETWDKLADFAQWLAQNALPPGLDTYWKDLLPKNLVILRDDDFRDLVLHTTEVITRIRLEPDTKTVARGALWTEEHLPCDSLLYTPVRASRLRTSGDQTPQDWRDKTAEEQAQAVLDWLAEKIPSRLQLGGDETVGRGVASLRWMPGFGHK